MPYCHNCGAKLPDGANFCPQCAAPVAAPAAEAPKPAAPLAGKPAPRRAKNQNNTALIVCIAAAAVVLLAVIALILVLSLSGRDTDTPLPEKQKDAAVEVMPTLPEKTKEAKETETEPLPEEQTGAAEAVTSAPAQSVDAAQLDALLDSYQSIADDILATADSDFGAQYDCGRLADYDGDGWPEMVLLYSPDGMALNALVVRRDEYSAEPIRFEAQLWPALAGGANGSFSAGTLDTGEHVLFVAATNWEGDVSVATTYVFSLEYGAVTPVYMLDYAFDLDGNLLNCHVMDGEGNTLSRDNEEQFLNVYNARDDVETSFLDDDPDTRLSALFSEDAMAEYRALWG